jgi:hypothetical protein
MLSAAVILMVVWPGYHIPPIAMPTIQTCMRAQLHIAAAARDYRRENATAVPGFKVWCRPVGKHAAIA